MNPLYPYDANSLKDFAIFAEIEFLEKNQIVLKFKLDNKSSLVEFKKLSFETHEPTQIKRQDELWKDICFELFLNPVQEKKYFEFNFSLTPAWNCYVFESYRTPQPPQASNDFTILQMRWSEKELSVKLENKSIYKMFNVGITAVLKDTQNKTHYFALKHAGQKPDFHLVNSFTLQKGS